MVAIPNVGGGGFGAGETYLQERARQKAFQLQQRQMQQEASLRLQALNEQQRQFDLSRQDQEKARGSSMVSDAMKMRGQQRLQESQNNASMLRLQQEQGFQSVEADKTRAAEFERDSRNMGMDREKMDRDDARFQTTESRISSKDKATAERSVKEFDIQEKRLSDRLGLDLKEHEALKEHREETKNERARAMKEKDDERKLNDFLAVSNDRVTEYNEEMKSIDDEIKSLPFGRDEKEEEKIGALHDKLARRKERLTEDRAVLREIVRKKYFTVKGVDPTGAFSGGAGQDPGFVGPPAPEQQGGFGPQDELEIAPNPNAGIQGDLEIGPNPNRAQAIGPAAAPEEDPIRASRRLAFDIKQKSVQDKGNIEKIKKAAKIPEIERRAMTDGPVGVMETYMTLPEELQREAWSLLSKDAQKAVAGTKRAVSYFSDLSKEGLASQIKTIETEMVKPAGVDAVTGNKTKSGAVAYLDDLKAAGVRDLELDEILSLVKKMHGDAAGKEKAKMLEAAPEDKGKRADIAQGIALLRDGDFAVKIPEQGKDGLMPVGDRRSSLNYKNLGSFQRAIGIGRDALRKEISKGKGKVSDTDAMLTATQRILSGRINPFRRNDGAQLIDFIRRTGGTPESFFTLASDIEKAVSAEEVELILAAHLGKQQRSKKRR